MMSFFISFSFFFFNDTATTEIYTLSLHDALPIYPKRLRLERRRRCSLRKWCRWRWRVGRHDFRREDRKSTRLNSSHEWISYAVFCLKKKTDKWMSWRNRKQRSSYTDDWSWWPS